MARPKIISKKKIGIEKPQPAKKKRLESDYEIAYDFATKAYKQFREVIKAIALFGGVAKAKVTAKSDIDIIIIIDDCTVNWDQELIAWYREELNRLVAKQKYAMRLHVNTVTLSTFWEELKQGEPLVINVLRYGQPLIDFGGFFDPLKVLLAKGRIKPTSESVFVTMERAAGHLFRANNNVLVGVEGFYWGMVDAAHAALMAENVVPPSPEHVADLLSRVFVRSKKLDKKYVGWFEEMRGVAKEITRGDMKRISGKKLGDLQKKSDEFVGALRKLAMIKIKHEKITRVVKKE